VTHLASRERVLRIIELLSQEYPDAHITLDFDTPIQLLVATILSAQSTDQKVNQITPALFARFRTCEDFASATPAELQEFIKPIGLYKNKSTFIIQACKKIMEIHEGRVPDTMVDLVALPGVARKTANVILPNAFGHLEGIIVDTHVKRLSRRLGLTEEKTPIKIEQDLMKVVPQEEWLHFANLLLFHGRAVCQARTPRCKTCVIKSLCPSRRE
jgi:endonuclease-3